MELQLDKLSKRDLIGILTTRSVDVCGPNVNQDVRGFFEDLFDATTCEKCVGEELRRVKCAVRRLEKRLENVLDVDCKGQSRSDDETEEMGIKTSTSETCDLAQIENDLKQFHEFCVDNKLTRDEIRKICQPLTDAIEKTKLKSFLFYAGLTIAAVVFFYSLSYFESINWHYSALARIFLIEIMPLWNWTHLKSSKCLIDGFRRQPEATAEWECTFCEFIDKMDVADAFDADLINNKYVKLHRPVILENAMENWTLDGNATLVEDVLNDPALSKSFPCKFSSNAYVGDGNLGESFRRINDQDVYFYHFQNCEVEAAKAFRKFAPRPGFLAPELSPIRYSWLLISENYKVERFKSIALRDTIGVVGQVVGQNVFRLHPTDCGEECSTLRVDLSAGEALVFTNFWALDYKPSPDGANVAVILEAH